MYIYIYVYIYIYIYDIYIYVFVGLYGVREAVGVNCTPAVPVLYICMKVWSGRGIRP